MNSSEPIRWTHRAFTSLASSDNLRNPRLSDFAGERYLNYKLDPWQPQLPPANQGQLALPREMLLFPLFPLSLIFLSSFSLCLSFIHTPKLLSLGVVLVLEKETLVLASDITKKTENIFEKSSKVYWGLKKRKIELASLVPSGERQEASFRKGVDHKE